MTGMSQYPHTVKPIRLLALTGRRTVEGREILANHFDNQE
jgi:hypothetical protein